ncbi:unnamed protein product [Tilletia laevis]|uniref:GDP/GTP exchange factor Sec2 N-terminal domain-containing protein n=2 Tax=Tilletia TaxID=13289 RepID=A0A177V9B7_9BASI|nr:hypothetical protein CF336_g2493 [Tilletia laevis]KAE8265762.1 hypothetical protein A4X03_0g60 [Tilletia caries]KAE8206707.1 hypothetical protein CF335_g1674 [Tilletia laevis]CAD6885423.1 unnamed protein product [Tilletia caries]CAD6896302.1 unnamed protein product [Tilletia caries]
MKASDAVKGAAAAAATAEPESESDELENANIERSLGRIDPEEILADEADPDVLLGLESDSDGNFSNRNSVASAFSTTNTNSRSRPITPVKDQQDDGSGKGSSAAPSPALNAGEVPGTPQASKHLPAISKLSASANAGLGTPATPTAPFHRATEISPRASPEPPSHADTIAKLEEHILDLSAQVTGLNEKLVRSFERISDLEDDVSDAHARVSSYSVKVAGLEKERQEHLAALNTGLLVEKAHVTSEMSKLMERVIEETAQRGKAESDKEKIEHELDELSASLFNEANKMVAVERLARARAEEKSNHLERSLKDTEALMLEQRKILSSLQSQADERRAADGSGDADTARGQNSASASAAASPSPTLRELAPSRALTRALTSANVFGGNSSSFGPYPTLLLLTNTVPYHEFLAFVTFLRKQRQSLAPFYNYPLYPKGTSGAGVDASADSSSSSNAVMAPNPLMSGGLGLSSGLAGALGSHGSSANLAAGYSREPTSPFAAAGLSRHRDYPSLPSNCESMVSVPNQISNIAFLKRAQEEDSEPALRLDLAPALSWLSRRSVQSSILDGSLVIEPVFPGSQHIDEQAIRIQNANLPPAACALCGTSVVNVPLPASGDGSSNATGSNANGTSNGSGGSERSGWASSISAVTGGGSRKDNAAANGSQSGSGNASSGSGSGSSGTLTTKSSLPSLFSSLRLGSSNRDKAAAASSNTITEGGDVEEIMTPTSSAPVTPVQLSYLPVPTHIFRINETANQRYLLCPHHCLARLRAVCAFWGYVRTLERSIVLEGKRPWQEVAHSGRAPPPPPLLLRSQTPEVPSKVEASSTEVDEGSEATKTEEDTSVPKATEPASDAVQVDESAAADETAVTANAEDDKKDEEVKEDADSTEKSEDADEKDAPEEDKEKADDDEPTKADGVVEADSAAAAPTPAAVDELKQASGLTPTTSTPASPRPIPPPLPARSTARRAVPAIPVPARSDSPAPTTAGAPPAPAVQPRTAIPMLVGSPPLTAASASAGSGSGADGGVGGVGLVLNSRQGGSAAGFTLGWEERAWQEIVKLKEDMWKARVGVREFAS